jgi:hypothetical protein
MEVNETINLARRQKQRNFFNTRRFLRDDFIENTRTGCNNIFSENTAGRVGRKKSEKKKIPRPREAKQFTKLSPQFVDNCFCVAIREPYQNVHSVKTHE